MEREEKIHKQKSEIISTIDGCLQECNSEHIGVRTDGGLYREMDSATAFISLFRCGDASCSWGQRRVNELIYVCCLAFFSSDDVYIASF